MSIAEIFGRRTILFIVLALAAFSVVGGVFFFVSVSQTQSALKLENLPFYDTKTQSIVLSNNTASLSGLTNCNVYVSGPSRQIKYYETVNCDSLSSTEISKQNLLNLFSNNTGDYTVIVYPENSTQGRILQFSIT